MTPLNLELPAFRSSNWHPKILSNFQKIAAAYGDVLTSVSDRPEVYRLSGTYNGTAGRVVALPKAVESVNDYVVLVNSNPKPAGAVGDVSVAKGTASCTVYCTESNTSDTFEIALYYVGTINGQGLQINREWICSADAAITDHCDTAQQGSLAWILEQQGRNPASITLPGNHTYAMVSLPDHTSAGLMSFTAATKVITDPSGDFAAKGFQVGMPIEISGSTSNDGEYIIAAVSATSITVEDSLIDEAAGGSDRVRFVIPSWIEMRGQPNALMDVAAGKDLGVRGAIVAEGKIFNPAGGTISALRRVNAAWWGASPYATGATNAEAIQAALSAMTEEGANFVLPPGRYASDGPLSVDGTGLSGGFLERAEFDFRGSITFTACNGLSLKGLQHCRIRINRIAASDRATAWAGTFYALKLDTVSRCAFDINMIYGFAKAINFYANGTMLGYLTMNLGEFTDNKFSLYFYQTGGGAINQNTYVGGRFALYAATKAATSGSYGAYYATPGSGQYNNHTFVGSCFESLHNGVYGGGQLTYSLFNLPRFESVDANWFESVGQGLTWVKGAENLTTAYLSSKLADLGIGARSITIIGNYNGSMDTSDLSAIATDEDYGGISWFYRLTPSNISWMKRGYSGLQYYDANTPARYQRFDKQYTGSAVPSTAGETYQAGAIVWNSAPTAGGPTAWICSDRGTVGTLSPARTGSITSGTKVITVSSAADLRRGQSILLDDGAGHTQLFTIDYLSGTAVTVFESATQTYSSAALTWRNPTWLLMAPIPGASTAASTGTITIKSANGNSGNSTGWLPYSKGDGTTVYIPYISNPSP